MTSLVGKVGVRLTVFKHINMANAFALDSDLDIFANSINQNKNLYITF